MKFSLKIGVYLAFISLISLPNLFAKNYDLSSLGVHDNNREEYNRRFFAKEFPLYSVTPEQIYNSQCFQKYNEIYSEDTTFYDDWFEQKYSQDMALLNKDSRELIYAELIEKEKKCNGDHFCVLKNQYKPQEYKRLLYLLTEFNINASFLRVTIAQRLEIEYLEELIIATHIVKDFLPDEPMRFFEPKYWDKELVGYRYNMREHDMELHFATRNGSVERVGMIIHEFLHHIVSFETDGVDLEYEFKQMTKKALKEEDRLGNIHGKLGYVSTYAATFSWEDIAESFVAYIFFPENLLLRSEAKFNFLKDNIFNGKIHVCNSP